MRGWSPLPLGENFDSPPLNLLPWVSRNWVPSRHLSHFGPSYYTDCQSRLTTILWSPTLTIYLRKTGSFIILSLLQIKWNIQKNYFWFTFELTFLKLFCCRHYEFPPCLNQKKLIPPNKILPSKSSSQNFPFPPASENSNISLLPSINGGKQTMLCKS